MLTIIFYVNILKARGIDFVAFDDLTVTYIGLLGACFIKPKIVNKDRIFHGHGRWPWLLTVIYLL